MLARLNMSVQGELNKRYRWMTTTAIDQPEPDTEAIEGKALERDMAALLNRYSKENDSDTPDFILASYMLDCLAAWNAACRQRESWYGRGLEMKPTPET